jgi:hypothetical protein
MPDETANLILEHLRHVRARIDSVAEDVADLKSRMSAQEEISGQILVMLGALGRRFDRSDERLARIERRLDMVEA